jgi:hypothetical protein
MTTADRLPELNRDHVARVSKIAGLSEQDKVELDRQLPEQKIVEKDPPITYPPASDEPKDS